MAWPKNLSLNMQSTLPRSLEESLPACAAAGVPAVGLYEPPHVEPIGIDKAAALLKASGIPCKIYASVGYWASGKDTKGRPRDLAGNIKVLDDAVKLGAEMIGASSSGLPPGDRDIRAAHKRIVDGLRELAPYAAERNIKIALEPVHPNYGPDRAIVLTLRHGLDIVEAVDHPNVGVVVDTYHQWWEHDLVDQLKRGVAGGKIFIVQVSDWPVAWAREKPLTRCMMGEGCIDFDLFSEGLAGYKGWFDMEVLSYSHLQALPVPEVLDQLSDSWHKTMGSRFPA
jgi:sugar phosphate isomerase/epimerase